MILTEIKHLNVRISEFEEPIFDQNILPIFITPLILKEVEIRKKSKHKIETLNPEKKLNFRSVSINVIVEELAARINKIALDLEPNYFIDPSYYNSLPYDVRSFLKKNTLKDEKKEVIDAFNRIALSTLTTLRGKKHILYARCRTINRRYKYKNRLRMNRKSYKALYHYKKKRQKIKKTLYGSYSEAANVRGKNIKPIFKKKNINKYRKLNFFPVTLRSTTAQLTSPSSLGLRKLTSNDEVTLSNPTKAIITPQFRELQPSNIDYLSTFNKLKQELENLASSNQTVPVRQLQNGYSKLLFSGWIPTSKGALMLLEDEGWDLDLLSNKNMASQRLKKIRPYSLRKLRRLRRLRRLRLMSINLYLHQSNNAKKATNNYTVMATSGTGATRQSRVGLNTPASNLAQKRRGLKDRLNSNLEKQVANLDNQGRNNSNIVKFNNKAAATPAPAATQQEKLLEHNYMMQNQMLTLGTCQGLTFTNRIRTSSVSTYRTAPIAAGLHVTGGLNNDYLIKRNNNKLNFIINWIGDNFPYSGYLKSYNYISNYNNYSNNSNSFVHTKDSDSILRAQKVRSVAAGNAALPTEGQQQQPQLPQQTQMNDTKGVRSSTTLLIDQFFTHTTPQRLNKRNIKDIFLVQTNKPIKLPTLEQLELPELPVLNKQQKALAGVALFKAANVKATENAKLYWNARKTKFLRRRNGKQHKNNWGLQKHSSLLRKKKGPFGIQVGGAIRSSKANYAPFRFASITTPLILRNASRGEKLRNLNSWGKATLAQNQSKVNITSRLSAIKSKVKNWKKKKDLSALLLEKTWQRYVNLQLLAERNINLFSDTNLPVNRNQVEDYYAKLYIKNLNKLKLLAKVTRPKAWNKIAAILKIGITTNQSSQLSYLPVREGRKTSQKKVKYPDPFDFVHSAGQQESNGLTLRTTAEENKLAKAGNSSVLALGNSKQSGNQVDRRTNHAKSHNIRLRRRTRLFWAIIKLYSSSFNPIFNSLNNKYLTSPAFFGKSTAQIQNLKNSITPVATQQGQHGNNIDILSPTELTGNKEHNATLIEGWTPALRPDSVLKKTLGTVKMDNKPTLTKETKAIKKAKAAHNSQAVKSKANSEALNLRSKPTTDYNVRSITLSHLTDNKRFLFLYFIIPIFFATLKNSMAHPSFSAEKVNIAIQPVTSRAPVHAVSVRPTLKNLSNQRKQLRALIKLMLNSGSVVKVQKNFKEVVSSSTDGQLPSHNLRSSSSTTDLLKWSISLIAHSLAPLKNKNEYYSLMFLNILKTKGFLNLKKNQKKKINKVQLQGYDSNQLDLQDKNKISLIKKGKVNLVATATESDTNKIPLLTYYPGGRYISDWKRITKVIWQEEYKFNAVYRRAKNSLKLTKINTKKNLKNRYTIITIFKLWNIINITSIKSVASLKVQVNFIKYANTTLYQSNRKRGRRTPVKNYSLLAAKTLLLQSSRKHLNVGASLPRYTGRTHLPLRCSGSTVNLTGKTSTAQRRPALLQAKPSVLEQYNFSTKRAQLLVKEKTLKSSKTSPSPASYGWQVNFLDNLKYVIIKLTLSVLETMEIKNRAELLSIRDRSLIKADELNSLLGSADNGGSHLVKKTEDILAHIFQQPFSFTFYDNYISWIKLNKFFKLREATSAASLDYKLTRLIKYIDSQVPFIFSIHRLDPFKKLEFLSKNVSLTVTAPSPSEQQPSEGGECVVPVPASATPLTKLTGPTGLTLTKVTEVAEADKKKITNLQNQAAKNFILLRNNEFNKNFNNLVNAKLTIIGKIRSIKLVELLDKIKENIIKDEELAALKRVADITNLNLINKKKSRHLNSSKYLNKKKIVLSNRIKILQTVETIKTDFRFESKLDSNALSKTPVSLLYYSNLQPLVNSGSVKPAEDSSLRSVQLQPYEDGSSFNPAGASATAAQQKQTIEAETERSTPPVLSSYLRELSIYNRETKGVINYFSKIVSYNFNANNNKISSSITDLLEASFRAMHCLISKPVFVITPKKVTIQLFYFLMVANKKKLRKIRRRFKSRFNNRGKQRIYKIYKKKRLIEAKNLNLYKLNEVFSEQFELLCGRLNKIFNKPVELNLIRLHYPTEDSNILANFMDILINKVTLAKIYKKVFKGSIIKTLITIKKRKYNDISIIPAFLTGLNIKIAGRIMTQKIKPRKTINLKHRGVTARGKINYLNFARLTNKNKRGSYSITISAGQNYFK